MLTFFWVDGLRKGQEVLSGLFFWGGGASKAIQKGHQLSQLLPNGAHTQDYHRAPRPQEKRTLIFGLKCTNIWKGIKAISEGIRGLKWPLINLSPACSYCSAPLRQGI